MTLGIMFLDMFKLSRVLEGREIPIQMLEPLVERGVSGANVADIAFEVLDVDGIEADDCGVEADVGFCWEGGGEEVGC